MTAPSAPLRVHLTPGPKGPRARVLPPPDLPVTAMLRGKDPESAAVLAGRVFNVCAAAQEAALRSALGMELGPEVARRVAGETLREHGVKLFLSWPALLGVEADRTAPPLLAKALTSGEARASLRQALFAPFPGLPGDWESLEAWMAAGRTTPARAFKALTDGWDPVWGLADVRATESQVSFDWPKATQGGAARENGVAARLEAHPLLRAVEARLGRGMLWRMTARLVEMEALLSDRQPSPLRGKGVVEAARGTLHLRAGLAEDGTVDWVERLTPTDFALTPGGVVDLALASLPGQDPDLAGKARLVLDVIDPCLATEVRLDA